MGTTYEVKFNNAVTNTDVIALKNRIDQRLAGINAAMSTYLPDSELSKINRAAAGVWLPLSEELYRVIREALAISAASRGAFDITVGPLVNLWGFGPDGRPLQVPDAATIESVRAGTGYEKIHLRDAPRALRKDMDTIYLDLSGIAKGYAVDAVAALLEQLSLQDYLVELGGEVRARGRNAQGQYWRIGIEKPDLDTRTVERVIPLRDIAMATSGNYRNFFYLEGERYSHFINPATGRPIRQDLASVTVLDQSCMTADAWATALFVLGPERGRALAENLGLSVFFITRNGASYNERLTSAFTRQLAAD